MAKGSRQPILAAHSVGIKTQQPKDKMKKYYNKRMKRAMHADTPAGLMAAYARGRKLAEAGGNEGQMYEAMQRCKSRDMADQLKAGFEAALQKAYKL